MGGRAGGAGDGEGVDLCVLMTSHKHHACAVLQIPKHGQCSVPMLEFPCLVN